MKCFRDSCLGDQGRGTELDRGKSSAINSFHQHLGHYGAGMAL